MRAEPDCTSCPHRRGFFFPFCGHPTRPAPVDVPDEGTRDDCPLREKFRTWTPTREAMSAPIAWQQPARVLVDNLFREGSPDDVIAAAFGVMAACKHHAFLVVTMPDRMRRWMARLDEIVAERLAAAPPRADGTQWALSPRDHCVQMARGLGALPFGLLATAYSGPWPLPNVRIIPARPRTRS